MMEAHSERDKDAAQRKWVGRGHDGSEPIAVAGESSRGARGTVRLRGMQRQQSASGNRRDTQRRGKDSKADSETITPNDRFRHRSWA